MLDTKARKGLHLVRIHSGSKSEQETYNWPDKAESVDTEDESNAEHCVDVARGMQLCALVGGAAARNARSSEDIRPEKCPRILVVFSCMLVMKSIAFDILSLNRSHGCVVCPN